ncbi:REEP2 protein, partial [Amia calva]|nr:REEP2 protein [Amia calva]
MCKIVHKVCRAFCEQKHDLMKFPVAASQANYKVQFYQYGQNNFFFTPYLNANTARVKWMMYWIVFAFFTTAETLTDIILSWFPFYFELKIAFVIWLLSPYTKGSSVLYRKFVHPTLSNKEKEIDEYITQARDRSYETMMRFGKRGLNLAASAAVTAATKGQGVLSEKLRSFSMQDLTLIHDEEDMHLRSSDPRLRSSAASQLDSVDDSGARSPAPSSSADESHHSQKSDGDQSDARTEQSDEDAAEKAPKRVVTTKATKKPVAKTEVQPSRGAGGGGESAQVAMWGAIALKSIYFCVIWSPPLCAAGGRVG